MKKGYLLLVITMLLTGCGNKLNEFEYADAEQQASFALLVGVDNSSDNYFRLLKNNDVVYFDTTFEDEVIVNPKGEFETTSREVIVGVYYDNFIETETTTYNEVEYIQKGSKNAQKNMRKYGYDSNFIYVMRDANNDLVFRMTNGEIDYNYFETKEAKKIYEGYINEEATEEVEDGEGLTEQEVAQIQYRVTDNETYLKDSEYEYEGGNNASIYAESVASCKGQCESKYMTYDEAVNLIKQEEKEGSQVYREWWKNNKSKFQDN